MGSGKGRTRRVQSKSAPQLTVGVDGRKEWRLNGLLHRVGGPAVEFSEGGQVWYRKGKLHRVGGPAVSWIGGVVEYWLNDKMVSERAAKGKKRKG